MVAVELVWLYLFVVILSGSLSFLIAKLSWSHEFPGHKGLSGVFVCAGFWSFGTVAATVPVGMQWHVFWNQVQLSGTALSAAFMALFAYWYTGIGSWNLFKHGEYALLGVPLLTVVLTWTNPWHGFVWDSVSLYSFGKLVYMDIAISNWFFIHIIYTYSFLTLSSVTIVWFVITSDGIRTDQTIAIILSVVTPLGVNMLYNTGLLDIPVPPTQGTFFISALLAMYSFRDSNSFSSTPATQVVGHDVLTENMDDGAIITDTNGKIVESNSKARELLSQKQLVGENVSSVLELPSGDGERFEQRIGSRVVEVAESSLTLKSKFSIGSLYVIRDITENRRKRQQLEVLNRILRHNLRNELNVVRGGLEQLSQNVSGEMRLAESAITSCENIIQVGEKARSLESIIEKTELTPTNINALVESTLQEYTDTDSVTVSTSLPENSTVLSIEELQRAIDELVENAVEHSTGTVSIHISGEHTEVNGGVEKFVLEVSDNGPGIPENEVEVLRNGVETDLSHMSGIGLWTVKWVVEKSGGELEIESTSSGTTIRVYLDVPGTDTGDESP